MKAKYLLLAAAVLFTLTATAQAAKSTYIATNHRFNYVKLKEVKSSLAEHRNMTHPATIDELGLRTALASINLSRSYVVKKEVDSQQVFDESSINFLAPNMVTAFMQAKPNEEVVFSFLSKQPLFILRNDRLNLGRAWISGNELHVKFDKLYAKVLGDTDKRGNEGEAVAKARGLRVRLELGPGQTLGMDDTDEVVLQMNYNYAVNLKKPEEPKVEKTMSGELIVPAADDSIQSSDQVLKGKKLSKKEKAKADAAAKAELAGQAAAPAASTAPTVKDRLQALDQLKKDGLVNKKEYDEKRKEILKDL